MITDSFGKDEAIFSPGAAYGEKKQLVDICLVTFSLIIWKHALDVLDCREIGAINTAGGAIPIVAFDCGGKRVGIYLSGIGSMLAGTDMIEANWITGARKFIMFGSAGNLNRAATEGKFVLPTAAFRDEGMSYHYAPAAEEIAIRSSEKLAQIFDELKLPYVLGKTWTTDAIYRETRAKVEKYQKAGCLTVEMELAGAQAVCDYHGWELYDFLATGDVLDGEKYTMLGLKEANHDMNKLYIAMEIAKRI